MVNLPPSQGMVTQLSVGGLIAITWVGAGLGILFTTARIAIRLIYIKRLLADDYFMLLALAFLVTNAVLQTLQAPHLFYLVLSTTGPDIVHHGLRYTYYEFAIIGLFWSVLWSVKASFLALFWMISEGLPRYRRVWWATIAFAVLAYIGCWIGSVYTCHPPSNYFKFGMTGFIPPGFTTLFPNIVAGKCTKSIDQTGSIISISYSTAVDILTDLLIMSLPLRILWQSKINMQQKIGLVILFCLGFVIVAAAIVRAVEITGKAYTDQVALAVWSVVESSISVVVGCLPPFRAIISNKSNAIISPYGSSGIKPSSHDRNVSLRGNRHSDLVSWSEAPLPLQDRERPHQSLGHGMGTRDVHISGGRKSGISNNSQSRESVEELRGDIRMVQEFRPTMTSLAPRTQQHFAATELTSACQMVYAIYRGSEDLYSHAQAVPTEAGTRVAHGPTAKLSIVPYNENSGFPIVAAQYNGSKTVHCCGTASWKNGSVSCGNFKSVSVPTGTAIPGVAGLAVKSSETSDGSPNVPREAAIGAGIGVPLAIMTIASISWAVRERRARFRALSTIPPTPIAKLPPVKPLDEQVILHHPVELGVSDISELGTGENNKRVTEPGSHSATICDHGVDM
ncbi:hypothetical protein N7535_008226 [Penicillium sp. DV-2018c]|nr:hypothetical protein N7535_008226 [Penicillium sp. DV-2018c]